MDFSEKSSREYDVIGIEFVGPEQDSHISAIRIANGDIVTGDQAVAMARNDGARFRYWDNGTWKHLIPTGTVMWTYHLAMA